MSLMPGDDGLAEIEFELNGAAWKGAVPVTRTVLDLLRDDLGLTGTKRGCEWMTCGACTVQVDGNPVSSCGMLAVDLDGRALTTIEGLTSGPALHPLQEEFVAAVGAQCGYCTSGQLMSAAALIANRDDELSDDEIAEWMSANLCRCGSYVGIRAAIRAAHVRIRASGSN